MTRKIGTIFSKVRDIYDFRTNYGRFFTIVLLLKIGITFFTIPQLYVHLFIPFIKNFIASGYRNPWNSFFSIGGDLKAFPYGTGMLLILTPCFAIKSLIMGNFPAITTALDIFLMRIPILAADFGILYLLIHSFKLDVRKSIYIYWGSPVVFYISYIFGQLDVIPMMLMLASILLLIKNRFLYSAIILGIGLTTKENLFIAVPFFLIYIIKKERSWLRLVSFFIILSITYILMIGWVFFSKGYQSMVFGASERSWVYLNSIPMGNFYIYLVPLAIGFLYLKFSLYNKVNSDILVMYVGLAFTVLLLFIPVGAPGWYMWIIPFLCYYFINSPRFHLATLVLFSILFIMFFMVNVPYPLNLVKPDARSALSWLTNNVIAESQTKMLSNLVFTFFQGIIAYIALMMYVYGVRSNKVYKERKAPLILGIGGNSGAGKDTLCKSLKLILGEKNIIQVNGDDHHKWERGHNMWKVFTHLNPMANDLFLQFDQAFSLRSGKTVWRRFYDHGTGKFSAPKKVEPNKYIFVSGLHPFYIRSMRDIIDIKIYMDTEENLRTYWKLKRDIEERNHSKEEVIENIEVREEDSLKYIEPQKRFADVVIQYETIEDLNWKAIDDNTELRVNFILNNSINLEEMIYELKNLSTLKLAHSYKDDDRQSLAVEGKISSEQLKVIAFYVIPNLNELTYPQIQFESDLKGIVQLVFLSILSYAELYGKG